MTSGAWTLLAVFLVVLGLLAWPLGKALAALCEGRIASWMRRVESPLLRVAVARARRAL